MLKEKQKVVVPKVAHFNNNFELTSAQVFSNVNRIIPELARVNNNSIVFSVASNNQKKRAVSNIDKLRNTILQLIYPQRVIKILIRVNGHELKK